VAVAKRIEAGQREVEEEILNSPIMLGCVIRIGEQVEASDGASTCCLSSQAWEISRTDANGTGGSHCLVGGAGDSNCRSSLLLRIFRKARVAGDFDASKKPCREVFSDAIHRNDRAENEWISTSLPGAKYPKGTGGSNPLCSSNEALRTDPCGVRVPYFSHSRQPVRPFPFRKTLRI
jgi:hypothetical protein